MPVEKENTQLMGTQIKTATVSSTKLAIAVAFLAVAALAVAAAGTAVKRAEKIAKQQKQLYGYSAPIRKVDTMVSSYGYNQPANGYGYNNDVGDLGYGYNSGSGSWWCAYGVTKSGYGFGGRASKYCAPTKTQKECRVMLNGKSFATMDDCKNYLSTI